MIENRYAFARVPDGWVMLMRGAIGETPDAPDLERMQRRAETLHADPKTIRIVTDTEMQSDPDLLFAFDSRQMYITRQEGTTEG